jgi:hypothetical protein
MDYEARGTRSSGHAKLHWNIFRRERNVLKSQSLDDGDDDDDDEEHYWGPLVQCAVRPSCNMTGASICSS